MARVVCVILFVLENQKSPISQIISMFNLERKKSSSRLHQNYSQTNTQIIFNAECTFKLLMSQQYFFCYNNLFVCFKDVVVKQMIYLVILFVCFKDFVGKLMIYLVIIVMGGANQSFKHAKEMHGISYAKNRNECFDDIFHQSIEAKKSLLVLCKLKRKKFVSVVSSFYRYKQIK